MSIHTAIQGDKSALAWGTSYIVPILTFLYSGFSEHILGIWLNLSMSRLWMVGMGTRTDLVDTEELGDVRQEL